MFSILYQISWFKNPREPVQKVIDMVEIDDVQVGPVFSQRARSWSITTMLLPITMACDGVRFSDRTSSKPTGPMKIVYGLLLVKTWTVVNGPPGNVMFLYRLREPTIARKSQL